MNNENVRFVLRVAKRLSDTAWKELSPDEQRLAHLLLGEIYGRIESMRETMARMQAVVDAADDLDKALSEFGLDASAIHEHVGALDDALAEYHAEGRSDETGATK